MTCLVHGDGTIIEDKMETCKMNLHDMQFMIFVNTVLKNSCERFQSKIQHIFSLYFWKVSFHLKHHPTLRPLLIFTGDWAQQGLKACMLRKTNRLHVSLQSILVNPSERVNEWSWWVFKRRIIIETHIRVNKWISFTLQNPLIYNKSDVGDG